MDNTLVLIGYFLVFQKYKQKKFCKTLNPMWNEEQAALIPAQSGPIAVDSEHLSDDLGRKTTSGLAVKVLCKYWSKILCICPLIYSFMVTGIFELV